ncbi:Nucleoside-diphosphate-sugar epimerase [Chelatococcus sambhunathii]|uniref:GDP-L-fucose synthase n=1 Tax=Chelatococcus sambhunathii TaxID=363953 RepID=A0ABM9U2X6_9HYPH|nr:GDP-L-fucose synthase [Chelatococcus sambhunathii]CUA86824.1 Nucleoside-diphosphate-sugar epimerase [Chelatococcus sambhunathii]
MTTILLTGGGGMVGRNIIDLCRERGIEVVAPRRTELDLTDHASTLRVLREVRPDIVVHAAGRVGGIQANIREPVRFLTENWDIGRNIVLAAREAGVTRLLNLGSSCMFPRNSPDLLKEEDVLSGTLEPTNEGYALAKCAVARLCSYVHREEPSLLYKTMIPCNLYGRYDKFDPAVSHLVPAVIHKLHVAKRDGLPEVEIWGDGTARREFMYSGDLADAILFAVDHFAEMPDVLNVGLGEDHSVNEYYAVAAEIVGYTGGFVYDTTKPVGMMRKLLDISRQKAFGWQAQTSLRQGLQATYDFYLSSGAADALSAR